VSHWFILALLRGLCVAGLASFQAPTTLYRLISLAAGNGAATITLTAALWNPNKLIRYRNCKPKIVKDCSKISEKIS